MMDFVDTFSNYKHFKHWSKTDSPYSSLSFLKNATFSVNLFSNYRSLRVRLSVSIWNMLRAIDVNSSLDNFSKSLDKRVIIIFIMKNEKNEKKYYKK